MAEIGVNGFMYYLRQLHYMLALYKHGKTLEDHLPL